MNPFFMSFKIVAGMIHDSSGQENTLSNNLYCVNGFVSHLLFVFFLYKRVGK